MTGHEHPHRRAVGPGRGPHAEDELVRRVTAALIVARSSRRSDDTPATAVLRRRVLSDYGRRHQSNSEVGMSRMIGRLLPSPAMVMAFIALLVAIGGTSYAALRLPPKSVGTAQLKNRAVTAAKVAPHSLTAANIKESALSALSVAEADHAKLATGLDKITYKQAVGATIPPAPSIDSPSVGTGSVFCDTGQRAIGGGTRLDAPDSMETVDGYPDGGGQVWAVHVANGDTTAAHGFTVFVICVPAAAVG
jgi:hypothetical protein